LAVLALPLTALEPSAPIVVRELRLACVSLMLLVSVPGPALLTTSVKLVVSGHWATVTLEPTSLLGADVDHAGHRAGHCRTSGSLPSCCWCPQESAPSACWCSCPTLIAVTSIVTVTVPPEAIVTRAGERAAARQTLKLAVLALPLTALEPSAPIVVRELRLACVSLMLLVSVRRSGVAHHQREAGVSAHWATVTLEPTSLARR
jgi:hypothetical protein